MPDLEPLTLTIKVNRQTGEIELVGNEIKGVAGAATEASGAVAGLSGAFAGLLGPLAGLISAGEFLNFLKQGIQIAEQENESLARLSFTLQQNGVSFAQNETQIKSWAQTTAETTRFSSQEYLSALERATQATKSLTQANEAVNVAEGLALQTHRSLSESIGIISSLMSGNQRSVMMLSREMGGYISVTDTAQQALTKLQTRFADQAQQEDSLTKSTAQLSNYWKDFEKLLGASLIPTVTSWVKYLTTELESLIGMFAMLKQNPKGFFGLFLGDWDTAYSTLRKYADAANSTQSEITQAHKVATEQRTQLTAASGKMDLQEMQRNMATQIQAIQAQANNELQIKNQTQAQKLAIIEDSYAKEKALIESNHAAFAGKEAEYNAALQKSHENYIKQKTTLEQRYINDSVAAQESWEAKNTDVMYQAGEAARKVADSISSEFGQTFAKLIVEGGDWQKAMKQMSTRIAEEVIADIIRIEIQDQIAMAIRTARATTAAATQTTAFSTASGVQVSAQEAVTASVVRTTLAVAALTASLNGATAAALALDAALAGMP